MHKRPFHLLLATILGLALVACGGGSSNNSSAPKTLTPWTGLYDGLNTLYLPYANGEITTASVPTIYAKVGDLGDVVAFGMDTGSTGTVVSQEYFHPGPNDTFIGQGQITYSSSGIIWSGNMYRSTVSFMSTPTQVAAQARVNILVVQNQTCVPHARDCTPDSAPSHIHFMGVGFNSGTGFTTTNSVVDAAANNPFTNLTYVNGTPLSTMRSGWILTNQGVYLGMSSELTKNFAFVKLDQNPETLNSAKPLWESAPAAIQVNGVTVQGVSLVDTGVGEMLISPVAANGYPAGQDLPTGVTMEVLFPTQQQPQPAFYVFSVINPTTPPTNPINPMTPGKVIVSNSTSDLAFVNTGRNFLQGFNYLYDAVSGYVGYGDNGNAVANPYRRVVSTK